MVEMMAFVSRCRGCAEETSGWQRCCGWTCAGLHPAEAEAFLLDMCGPSENKYCQQSCFDHGKGYKGDDCSTTGSGSGSEMVGDDSGGAFPLSPNLESLPSPTRAPSRARFTFTPYGGVLFHAPPAPYVPVCNDCQSSNKGMSTTVHV